MKMKKIFFAATLIASLISFAVGQDDSGMPQASLDREVDLQVPARSAVLGNPSHLAPGPPTYCKPCLFYAGDFDSNASDANGLGNEVDIIVSTGAATYTPFVVPKGKTWTVYGLFTNNFLVNPILDPTISPYEIRKGIPAAGGNGGTLVCHGRKPATITNAGVCPGCAVQVYATKVEHIKGCRLKSGKYWMTVIPYCTNPNDSGCVNGYRGLLSNDDGGMAHRFGGMEPANNSFFNSVFFGANWEPSSKVESSARFSIGVEGTSK